MKIWMADNAALENYFGVYIGGVIAFTAHAHF